MLYFWIISCLLLISRSHGYPGVALFNLGTDLETKYKGGVMFKYKSGRENDTGVNIDARTSGDGFVALGGGAGVQVGKNGETGGSGLAVGTKTVAGIGGNVRGHVVGNWYDKEIETGVDIGLQVKKPSGFNAGVFWDNPQNGDNWSSLNNWGSKNVKRK